MAPYDSSSRALATQRPQSAMTVDNLFRRVLKVANPRDPDEVAKALLARYTDDAALIKREQSGVPFSAYQFAEQAMRVSGPLSSEIHQATDDLERDLGALVSDIQLKDIAPELRGLANAVRNAAGMGLDAARLALDPAQRDRAFAARRTLGDYSRIVRLLGALTACATALYCRVAQSIDLNANLILVSMGEALAAAGVTKSGGLLQVPASELQTRRDAVIGALRRLLGVEDDVVASLGAVLGNNPGAPANGSIAAVNAILSELDSAGASELRTFLDENFVRSQIDGLLDNAVTNTSEGLRSLGSTAAVVAQSFKRFADLTTRILAPGSTTRATLDQIAIGLIGSYGNALTLIANGFAPGRAGYRLPFLSRSPLLSYGLYGIGGSDDGSTLLQSLAAKRSQFAELVDCLCCRCEKGNALAAAIASKAIFDLDRTLDLIALGEEAKAKGTVEAFAAAYGYILDVSTRQTRNGGNFTFPTNAPQSILALALPDSIELLRETMRELRFRSGVPVTNGRGGGWGDELFPPVVVNNESVPPARGPLKGVLMTQRADEERWRRLALAWSPICDQKDIMGDSIDNSVTGALIDRAIVEIR